jgi:glycosyltransferase involved in cell wall biosynthesis
MHILHIYKDYFPVLGGIENHVKLLAEAQAARGHDVTVLVTSRTRQTHSEMLNGVRVIFASRLATISSAPISLALLAALWREKPDVTHLHFPYPIGDVANLFCGKARRTVITYHSDIVRQKNMLRLYHPFLLHSLARAHRILATSPRYIETSPYLAPVAGKCTVVPYGIPIAQFEKADAARVHEIRAQYGERLILFVGQLRYYKGVEILIRAMAQVNGKALLIGGETTTRRAELETLAREMGVTDRVFLLGEAFEELPAFYHASDLFVLPSVERSEAFGIVQLEAMAAGRPVVCTELGTGTSFVNVNEETGLVIRPRDPDALAAAITRLLDDPNLRARMGAAGHTRVCREFTLEKMVERVMGVYEQVANPKGL